MSEEQRKVVKVRVRRGRGRPPGYMWTVQVLDVAHREGLAFLTDTQHRHMRNQVKELARQRDPAHSETIDVRQIEDFYEIRDKGGVLAKLNVRVFFFVHQDRQEIVVLSVINKKNDGKTKIADRIRARNRMRRYLSSTNSG